MDRSLRIKILSKLAQTQTTEQSAQTAIVSVPLPSFVATTEYPTLITGFGPALSRQINILADALNKILHYYSKGKHSLKQMKASGFTPITDSAPDINNLSNFATLVFNYFFNGGNKFTKALTAEEMIQRLNVITTSSYFANLKDTPLSGQLATNIGGTASNKVRIKTILDGMRTLIPA